MFDFIGDIHGYASELEHLLKVMGYRKVNGAYRHAERRAVFLGDFIDRGPAQVEVVRIVRSMVDGGSAIAILGNHEYNAVAYATEDPEMPGQFLRKHSERNRLSHKEFLCQAREGSPLYREIIAWFKTLPMYVECDDFRAIHACWHNRHIEESKIYLKKDLTLYEESWIQASRKGSEPYHIFETLLKGMEISLPDGVSYHDKDGNERKKTRTRWWDNGAKTYRELGLVPSDLVDKLPDCIAKSEELIGYSDKKPLFFGHYWMSGVPSLIDHNIACLDYSIGSGSPDGILCAYRWNGDDRLNEDKFVWVKSSKVTNG